jgi:hypothetical protein
MGYKIKEYSLFFPVISAPKTSQLKLFYCHVMKITQLILV